MQFLRLTLELSPKSQSREVRSVLPTQQEGAQPQHIDASIYSTNDDDATVSNPQGSCSSRPASKASFLKLAPELRVLVYKNMLHPNDSWETELRSLRATCHLVQQELDHEVIKLSTELRRKFFEDAFEPAPRSTRTRDLPTMETFGDATNWQVWLPASYVTENPSILNLLAIHYLFPTASTAAVTSRLTGRRIPVFVRKLTFQHYEHYDMIGPAYDYSPWSSRMAWVFARLHLNCADADIDKIPKVLEIRWGEGNVSDEETVMMQCWRGQSARGDVYWARHDKFKGPIRDRVEDASRQTRITDRITLTPGSLDNMDKKGRSVSSVGANSEVS